MTTTSPTLAEFTAQARAFLAEHGFDEQSAAAAESAGSERHNVAVFHDLSHEAEAGLIKQLQDWQACKFAGGYGALMWPEEHGGRGLSLEHEKAFSALETALGTPIPHELVSVTLHLIAPTLRELATTDELRELIAPMLRGELLACQLFSEPGAGSDLAALGTRARRDGDTWVITGQKVWTSGAQFAQWGELIARTDPDLPKHKGMTAFMVPLDAEGIEVRPLRQMSGGTSFNEVFLTEVRIPDSYRIGEVGRGWQVALTTLGFERTSSGDNSRVGASLEQTIDLARRTGAVEDPVLRQELADLVIAERLAGAASARDEASTDYDATAVLGSMRKLQWVNRLRGRARFAEHALGPRLSVDDGSEGTFSWQEHVLGTPGYRIAGGSDEIQRNLIAERLLGLPAETRADKDVPWRNLPR